LSAFIDEISLYFSLIIAKEDKAMKQQLNWSKK